MENIEMIFDYMNKEYVSVFNDDKSITLYELVNDELLAIPDEVYPKVLEEYKSFDLSEGDEN